MTDDLKQRLRVFAGDPILGGVIDEAADRIEQIEKERDELLADAMRYQWLRKKIGVDCDHVSGAYVWLPTAGYRMDEHDQRASDAAIDAAISKLKGQDNDNNE